VARVTSISKAVKRGVAKAERKAPGHINVLASGAFSGEPTEVIVVTRRGVSVSLRNWVVNTSTGEASCKAYHTFATPNDPLGQLGPNRRESTLRGGTIEELIQSTVMAVALGVYDV
jgi:hypothetical protein